MIAYKLFTVRKDGTIGPLFINAPQRIPTGDWLPAEAHRRKGFAYRPGWHCCRVPVAPHIKLRDGRAWYIIEVEDFTTYARPESQGGAWILAKRMRVIGPLQETT
jgi:hypothetical protein